MFEKENVFGIIFNFIELEKCLKNKMLFGVIINFFEL